MAAERSMDPILLVGGVIVLAAALTWILPAGRFERVRDASGRTLVVPGSYKTVPRTPVGPWGVLTSAPDGLIEAADVVFYVFLAGAALTVVEATGAIGGTIDRLARRFAKRPILILILASLLFLVGGASYSMYEETIAFIPLLAALTRRLGIPGEVAVGISVGTSSIAQNFSPVDTFHLGIGQRMAELPLFSGAVFRSVVFLLAIAIWGGYLAWYARRFRGAPRVAEADAVAGLRQRPRYADAAVLATLNAGIVALLLGAIFLHWELRHFAAVFVGVGWVAGLAGGLGWRGTAEQFAEGFRRLAMAALLVGLARAISVVLANGQVLDTIANALLAPLRSLPLTASAIMMLIAQFGLAFPMPSDSGRAMISLPVMIPLADLLGLSRQMVVNAYQFGSLISNLITPTGGTILAMVAMADVSFSRWLRFIAIPFALLAALSAAAMVIGVRLGV